VKALAFVADPPIVVTTMFFAPTVPAGVFALIDPAVDVTIDTGLPSIASVEPTRFVPAMVMVVPPTSGPEAGDTLLIVGDATYANAPTLVAVPPAVITDTSRAPAAPAGVFPVMDR
jgi:hypothetical protein